MSRSLIDSIVKKMSSPSLPPLPRHNLPTLPQDIRSHNENRSSHGDGTWDNQETPKSNRVVENQSFRSNQQPAGSIKAKINPLMDLIATEQVYVEDLSVIIQVR